MIDTQHASADSTSKKSDTVNYCTSLIIYGDHSSAGYHSLPKGDKPNFKIQLCVEGEEPYSLLESNLRGQAPYYLSVLVGSAKAREIPTFHSDKYVGNNGYFHKLYADLVRRNIGFDESNSKEYYEYAMDQLRLKIESFASEQDIDVPADLLASFISKYSRNPGIREALTTHSDVGQEPQQEIPPRPSAKAEEARKKSGLKIGRPADPEGTINRLLGKYRAAAAEFAQQPPESPDRIKLANTLINAFTALRNRAYDTQTLPHRDLVTEAQRIKRARTRARAKELAG